MPINTIGLGTAGGIASAQGHIDGCLQVFNSVSTVDISTGQCRDDTDTATMIVSSTLTADITASGANGLDTGAEAADTWYALFVIGTAGGTVAALLSTSATSPTLPAGYVYKRRIGWVRNNGSSNIHVFHTESVGRDRLIRWDIIYTDTDIYVLAGGTATSPTDIDCSTAAPPTSYSLQVVYFSSTTVRNSGYFYRNGSTLWYTAWWRNGSVRVDCDSSQVIEYALDAGNGVHVRVYGYWDGV
jgi:hypothetical protein